jgi:hypothetical protein
MIREHKNGSVERRVVAPPPLPTVVVPRSANRPEHVPADNPGSNIDETTCRKIVIDARRAAVASNHLVKCSSGEEPLVYGLAADSERVGEVLIGASTVAIERNGETVNP